MQSFLWDPLSPAISLPKVLRCAAPFGWAQHLVLEPGTAIVPLAAFPQARRQEDMHQKQHCKRWTRQWACKLSDGLMDMSVVTRWNARKIHDTANGLPEVRGEDCLGHKLSKTNPRRQHRTIGPVVQMRKK